MMLEKMMNERDLHRPPTRNISGFILVKYGCGFAVPLKTVFYLQRSEAYVIIHPLSIAIDGGTAVLARRLFVDQ